MTSEDSQELASIDMIDMDENEKVDGEFIPTEVKDDKMIKRNSVDNYKNDSAGVRETLANSVAAIMEAETEEYITAEEGKIDVKLEYEDERWKLTIRDNGIGMTRDRLDIVSNMGDSTSNLYEDRIGKYGIGFFAIFLLVELSGGFLLATKSRKTGEEYLTRWRLRGAKVIEKGDIPQFSENEYGTQIELYLKEDISHEDVDEWIRTHAFASRRTVEYTKQDRGGLSQTTVYPNVDLTTEYATEGNTFVVDSDWFTAVTSPTTESHRLLLDISVPTEYTFSRIPWSIALRFHTEEKTVIATDDHSVLDESIPDDSLIGMSVLPSDQYDMTPDELKEDYIPKRDLPEEAVYTPSTAGTRDSLSEVSQFMDWLQNAFVEQFKHKIDPILDKELPKEATEDELLFLYNVIGDCNSSRDIRRTLKPLTNKDLWNSSIQDDLGNLVEHRMKVEETTCRNLQDELSTSYSYGSKKYSAIGLHEFAEENDVSIYMGVNINESKAEVAKKYHSDVIFIKLSEAKEYDIYEPLGWNKLKNINKSFIRNLDVDETVQRDYLDILEKDDNEGENSVHEESITVRFGVGRSRNLSTLSVSDLVAKLQNGDSINGHSIDKVVLFPNNKSENVSDYYDLGGPNTCVAKCSQEVAEHLTAYAKVQQYSDYYKESLSVTVPTTYGYLTGKELRDMNVDSVIGTIIGNNAYSVLDEEKLDESTLTQTYKKIYTRVGRQLLKNENEVVHITLTPSEEQKIRPVLQEIDAEKSILYGSAIATAYYSPDWDTESGTNTNIDTAQWILLMKINSSNVDNKSELTSFVSKSSFNFGYGGEEFVEIFTNGFE